MSDEPLLEGARVIKRRLADLPDDPGVYRMLGKDGGVLYVGKARSLKKRVASYTQIARLPARLQCMVAATAGMEIVTTRSEAEALLLEANLIKTLKPRYNILLKDDKSFPYILLTTGHPFPRIAKHRGARTERGTYFGPFAGVGAVNHAIVTVQRAFGLRPCPDTVFNGRTRPCLQYQIRRCSGPCVGKIGAEEYAGRVAEAEAFLSGRNRELQERIAAEMQAASERMDYETAAALRDRMRALTQVQAEHALHAPRVGDADAIACVREGGRTVVAVCFYRGGQFFGSRSYFPAHAEGREEGEVLEAFTGQFYQSHEPPPLVLLSHAVEGAALLEEALSVALGVPQKGEKRDVVERALGYAREALGKALTESAATARVLEQLAEAFGLADAPERIEVYDNSHISGRHALGAMIVAGPEGFEKKHYRTFNIKDALTVPGDGVPSRNLAPARRARGATERRSGVYTEVHEHSSTGATRGSAAGVEIRGGDDYAMMREVLTRRFRRLKQDEADDAGAPRPDLILIDGGAGQLGVAVEVLRALGVEGVAVAAIAKGPERNAGRERMFLPGREPFSLEPGGALLHYLQRLRDEAHRFAIGTHRDKRSRAIRETGLAAVPGIGPSRRKALLHYFGSAKAVADASIDELTAVPGISPKMAAAIHAHLR